MRHGSLVLSLSAAFLWAGVANADNVTGRPNLRSPVQFQDPPANLKPHVNPLRAPDTSNIGAVNRDKSHLPGTADAKVDPRAYGSFGIPYTSTRVSHGDTNQTSITANFLATTYPYRAIGQLSMSSGTCSASVIRRGVIVTAAHCITNFGSSSNFTGFLFTPAYYAPGSSSSSRAPYGVWDWDYVVWPTSWSNGTDTGSGSARNNDLAVMILRKNSSDQLIGDVVGSLNYGWNNYSFTSSSKTGNLDVAAMSTLGYPGLFDRGGIMQRADGPAYLTTVSDAKQIWQGNNFTGGSSGGPWIVNFISEQPNFTGGATAGSGANPVIIVGVTSWGTSDPNRVKDNYSSQFGQNKEFPKSKYGSYGAGNIASLLDAICKKKPSGSSKTYAQLGYCD